MTQYIAFLRAVNVGGRTIKMADLRNRFTEAGYANVSTYIQSGNVIFESDSEDIPALERGIESLLLDSFDLDVPTFIRTADQVRALATTPAFDRTESDTVMWYISFLHSAPSPESAQRLLTLDDPTYQFHLHENNAFWLRDKTDDSSKFTNGDLEKVLGVSATRRNLNTVRKIGDKL